MSSNILVLESINTAQKYLKRFNVNSNMMAALHRIASKVYRLEQKVKKGQHMSTFMDM
jgi:hypothetical protein